MGWCVMVLYAPQSVCTWPQQAIQLSPNHTHLLCCCAAVLCCGAQGTFVAVMPLTSRYNSNYILACMRAADMHGVGRAHGAGVCGGRAPVRRSTQGAAACAICFKLCTVTVLVVAVFVHVGCTVQLTCATTPAICTCCFACTSIHAQHGM